MGKNHQKINTYAGKEEFFKYYENLANELRAEDFYYAFAFQNEYQSGDIKKYLKEFHLKLAEKNIDDRAIFDKTIEAMAKKTYSNNENIQTKFKDFHIPVGLVVTKDRVLQLGWKPEPFIIEINNKSLFRHYCDFFMENWNSSEAIEFTKEALEKFKYAFVPEALQRINNLRDNKLALKTTQEIEKIENSWKYKHKSNKRDFGQKVKGETIKLWSVPRSTAELLEFFTVATKSKKILEIGTSAGYSTLYLAMGATYNKGNVVTLEKLKEKADLAMGNFKKSGLKNISLLVGSAEDILKKNKFGKLDMIFLDADKENYGKYFDLLMPLLKKGGFIVADNVFDYGHMMKDYLDKVLGTKLPNSQSDRRVISYTLPIDNGVIITRKIKD
ncbi:MAG: class I SAM-dependent methyltransferase [Candidatus Moranbacteria bacterium]|nr:class I SAM-dependent methyltransferase [Candidatus Moranbacteria bacterium]